MLGTFDAALADAELIAALEGAHLDSEPRRALLEAVIEHHGWLGAQWWSLADGRPRALERAGSIAAEPAPRLGVGPLGRALRGDLPDGVQRVAEEPECPRCRRAAGAGASWIAVLRTTRPGAEGLLELHGSPRGGIGPERVALLRHVAWLAGAACS